MRITQSQLRRIIKEEISKISENEESDLRQSNDPERILSDIGRRAEALSQKVRAAKKNVEDDDLRELLSDISSELNMYVSTTYKFRHDYKS
jgi:hypothetical protein